MLWAAIGDGKTFEIDVPDVGWSPASIVFAVAVVLPLVVSFVLVVTGGRR